jgi:hypothetical protein
VRWIVCGRSHVPRGSKRVQGSFDVDRPNLLRRCRARDHEREVNHDVTALECLSQRVGVANVTAAVLHLAPAVLGRIERTPRDTDDPSDALLGLEQRHQPEPKGSGRPGDGDDEPCLGGRHATTVPDLAADNPDASWLVAPTGTD